MGAKCSRHCSIVGVAERSSYDAATIIFLLIVTFDIPRRVIRDDEDCLGPVTDRSVDFHRVDAERAIAGNGDDLAPRICQGRGNTVGRTHAQAAEGPGIQVGACGQPDASKTQQVAAIGNRNVIGIGNFGDRLKNFIRVDPSV